MARRPAARPPRRASARPSGPQGVRVHRGRRLHRAAGDRVRRRHRSPSPWTATSCRCAPTRARHGGDVAAGRLGAHARARPRRARRRASPTRRSRCSPRRLPGGRRRRSSSTASSSRCRCTSRSGHALELDRMLGCEAPTPGTSFVRPERPRRAALRLRRAERHRRRDAARRRSARSAGTTRASQGSATPLIVEGVPRGRAVLARDRGRRRPRALRRLRCAPTASRASRSCA